jgi:ABC-2 type transport system permease protein
MPLHDIGYQHWDGAHLGVWRRRWVIAAYGLRACTQKWWMRLLIALCWFNALLMAAILFLTGQLLVENSFMAQWATNLNPTWRTFANLLIRWLEQHPEISVPTTQNLLFYYFSTRMTGLAIFALGLALPLLITRDLGSNAIIIYSSKAVTRGDYLLGKFATAFGFLALAWLGPMLAAWLLGNLLAPQWSFFWHSRAVLGNVLVYGLSSLTILSLLALGVSAVSRGEKSTVALWYSWWVLGGIIVPLAASTRPWLRHISFNFDLHQLALAVFRPDRSLTTAQNNIPVLGELLRMGPETRAAFEFPAIEGALIALGLMLAVAAFLLYRRVKPE